MSAETTILVALVLPLAAAGACLFFGRLGHPNLRDLATPLIGVCTFAAVWQLGADVLAGGRPELVLLEVLPGVELAFQIEPLGLIYGLVASGLWIPTSIYAVGYMRGHHEKNQTRFFTFFALSIFAALGIAFARNLFTLFLFYEALTLLTFPLVTHHGTAEARRAGRVYLGILLFTSISFLLLAILFTWRLTGTVEFTPGGILAADTSSGMVTVLLLLYAFGAGKAALMPLHRWLPNAMVAPTPVSALLHAVAVVKAGVFTILKVVVYVFGLDLLRGSTASLTLMTIASFTMLMAAVVAIRQDNLKARLAYSTISQLALHRPRRGDGDRHRRPRRRHAARHACGGQDHPLLLRRRHPGRHPQEERQRTRRPRPAHALDLRRLLPRLALDHRHSAARRVVGQVVSHDRRARDRLPGPGRVPRRADAQLAAGLLLPDARRRPRLLRRAAGRRRRRLRRPREDRRSTVPVRPARSSSRRSCRWPCSSPPRTWWSCSGSSASSRLQEWLERRGRATISS